MKKILSLVLVIALVLGSFSFAFAAAPADVVDTDYEQAVETLMALGVISGYPDGTYRPANVVTRAEMAKLLIYILGYGDLAGGTAGFSDTAGHWAEGTIGLAAGIGLVQGYPDGSFKPDATVTFDEAITMIVRALGYTDESLRGTWPTNYKIKAIDLSLLKDVSVAAAGANRGAVAQMLYNALEAEYGEVDTDGNWVTSNKVLVSKIGAFVEKAWISYEDIYDEDDALDTAIDLSPYLFHQINYYENADEEIAYVSKVHTSETSGTVVADKVAGSGLEIEYASSQYKQFAGVTSATALFLNGDMAGDTDATELATNGSAWARVVYKGDTVYGVVAEQFYTVRIETEYSTRSPLVINRDIKLPVVLDSANKEALDTANVVVEGDAATLAAIEEDDVVHVYASEQESDKAGHPTAIKLVVARDVVTARYTEKSDSNYTFGSTTYKLSPGVSALSDPDGEIYDIYLDKDGKIFAIEAGDDDTVVDGYAVFVAAANGEISDNTSTSFESNAYVKTTPRVKLFTAGGDVVTYNVKTSDLKTATSTWTTDAGITVGGDLDISYTKSGDDAELIVIADEFEKADLVKYKLNSKGELIYLDVMTSSFVEYDVDDMLLDGNDVTSATIVFNVYGDDEDDWTISNVASLNKDIEGNYAISSTNYRVLAMTVQMDTLETYAVVKNVANFYDGDDLVQRITVLVDGVSKTYLTDASGLFNSSNARAGGDDESFVKLIFDGDKITDFESTTSMAVEVTVDTVDGSRIRDDEGNLYRLASNVVVYILETVDETTTPKDSISVGTLADILRNDNVSLYDTVEESSGSTTLYEVVIVDLRADL